MHEHQGEPAERAVVAGTAGDMRSERPYDAVSRVRDGTRMYIDDSAATQIMIRERSVNASLEDVQAAAARFPESLPPGQATVENTARGAVLHGPLSGPDAPIAGSWVAAVEVREGPSGTSTLSGTLGVVGDKGIEPGHPLRGALEVTADVAIERLARAAEGIARQRSTEVERPSIDGAALADTVPAGRPVTLTGWLVADPVRSTIKDGDRDRVVTNFRIGVDKDGARTFYNVAAWDKTAEAVAAHKKKGHRVTVSGREQERTWTGRDGKEHTSVNVSARRVQFLPPERQVQQQRDRGGGDMSLF